MARMWAFVTVMLALLSAHLGAENWPHWRGPSASGVSRERQLPDRWSDTENVAWKARLRGVGISSPIVWGDLVVVTSQVGSGDVRPGPRLVQAGIRSRPGKDRLVLVPLPRME